MFITMIIHYGSIKTKQGNINEVTQYNNTLFKIVKSTS